MPAYRLLYVTCPDVVVAQRIADTVVEERLAACANLLPGMRSVYRWQGKVEHADEAVLILKTTARRTAALIRRVKTLHPYEVPCIVALPISGGYAPFLAWVGKNI